MAATRRNELGLAADRLDVLQDAADEGAKLLARLGRSAVRTEPPCFKSRHSDYQGPPA